MQPDIISSAAAQEFNTYFWRSPMNGLIYECDLGDLRCDVSDGMDGTGALLRHPATSRINVNRINEHWYRSGRTLKGWWCKYSRTTTLIGLFFFSFQFGSTFGEHVSYVLCLAPANSSEMLMSRFGSRLWTWRWHPTLASLCLVTHMPQKPVGWDGPLWFARICCTLGVHFSLWGVSRDSLNVMRCGVPT